MRFFVQSDLCEYKPQSLLPCLVPNSEGPLRISGTSGGFAIESGYTPVVTNL